MWRWPKKRVQSQTCPACDLAIMAGGNSISGLDRIIECWCRWRPEFVIKMGATSRQTWSAVSASSRGDSGLKFSDSLIMIRDGGGGEQRGSSRCFFRGLRYDRVKSSCEYFRSISDRALVIVVDGGVRHEHKLDPSWNFVKKIIGKDAKVNSAIFSSPI